MATQYASEYTNAFVTTPSVKNKPYFSGGRIRTAMATFTQGAADGSTDTLYMLRLPSGATVLDGSVSWGTGNTSETLAVGIVGTTAKFLAATACTTASTAPTACVAHLASGATYTTTADTDVIVTIAGANIKAAQAITLVMRYVID